MKISVITVSFNSAATIVDSIRSVASQSYPDVEHIVVDGGSRDGTQELVRSCGERIAKFVSERDEGIYDAMNKGIRLATGDVVGFLNSDDVFASPEALETIARVFDDPSVDLCYGDVVYVARNDPRRVVRRYRSGPYLTNAFDRGWMPAHPTFYVRRRCYEELGGFDLEYKLQADFELAMRFIQIHRLRSVYLPQVMVRMLTGGASNASVRNVIRGNLEAYRACRKHQRPVGPLFVIRKVLSRIPQFLFRPKSSEES